MLSALSLVTALSASPAAAQEEESALYMVDMRMEVELPERWTVPRWGDWYLDGVDTAKTTQAHVEFTNYQVPPTKDSVKVWTDMAKGRLEDQSHTDVQVVRAEVAEIDGEPVADIELSYRYEGNTAAVYYQRSFMTDGRSIHLSTSAHKRNAAKAEDALKVWRGALKPKKAAQDLSALSGEVATEAGFKSTLPPGWRVPLDSELTWVREIAAHAGQANLDKEKCWVAVHPYGDSQAALLMSCKYELWTGVVDEHSWPGWEQHIREHFFGDLTVQPAEKIPVSADGRDGFLYALPDNGERAIRMAVAPYNQGHVLTYAIGKTSDTGTLDGAIRASMVSTEFTDADGAHPVGAYQWIDYYWNFRRSSPVVWGPAVLLLGLLGVVIVKVRGSSKPSWDEDEV